MGYKIGLDLAWGLVNLLAPVLVPVLGILLLKLTKKRDEEAKKFKVMTVFKDGQLAWIAAVFCCAAFYEYAEADIGDARPGAGWHWMLVPLLLCTVSSIYVGADGAVSPTEIIENRMNFSQWRRYYQTFMSSMYITVGSVISFALIHYFMLGKWQWSLPLTSHPRCDRSLVDRG